MLSVVFNALSSLYQGILVSREEKIWFIKPIVHHTKGLLYRKDLLNFVRVKRREEGKWASVRKIKMFTISGVRNLESLPMYI